MDIAAALTKWLRRLLVFEGTLQWHGGTFAPPPFLSTRFSSNTAPSVQPVGGKKQLSEAELARIRTNRELAQARRVQLQRARLDRVDGANAPEIPVPAPPFNSLDDPDGDFQEEPDVVQAQTVRAKSNAEVRLEGLLARIKAKESRGSQ